MSPDMRHRHTAGLLGQAAACMRRLVDRAHLRVMQLRIEAWKMR